eukprot:TRINITY_DN1859_c0_g3_i1.p2 TRINITY_DN1859_c0_g3~~TRINITY_DN1859_c0_g3_i1.p2  ORF type:complete len:155 (+),score=33.41 TRINITY_DN1859_c0_g3_i1:65-466(+)
MEFVPIVEVAKRGNVHQIEEQLNEGVDVNSVDTTGCSALHWAAGGGHISAVVFLLRHKANPNITNLNGDTALHKAAWRQHGKVCEILVGGGADITVVNKEGKMPMDLAKSADVRKTLVPAQDGDEDECDSDSD